MKFPHFAYAAPTTVDEALAILAGEDDARPLAGGQSLLPIMALRLAAPSLLVDLNAIPALRETVISDDGMRIGAMVTHAMNAASFDIWMHLPLMSQALHHVAHQAVRNRGTFGGSLAHADAGAEMPLILAALGGDVILRSLGGERAVPAADFFQGHYATAIEAGEILVAADLPFSPLTWAFEELARRSGDLAISMAAVGVGLEDNICREARIWLGSIADRPLRAEAAEDHLRGRPLDDGVIREAARLATADVHPRSDGHANADYRRAVTSALVRRALARIAAGDI